MRVNLNKEILIIIGVLVISVFIFPSLLLMAAAFVGYLIVDKLTSSPAEEGVPPPSVRRLTATAEDPAWRALFLASCESPAETAFLEAMIPAYGLLPEKGILKGGNLSLDMQVEVKPYRLDFLANDWLVVEIDGATYHSSPEDVAKDRIRDQFLEAKGYTVLRIAAKVVFSTPEEAVQKVRSAIAVGRRPQSIAAAEQARPVPNWSLGQTLIGINNFVGQLNSYVETAVAVQEATSQLRQAFNLEKLAIDGSIEHARSQIEVENFRSLSEEHKNLYDAAYRKFAHLHELHAEQKYTLVIPAITPPKPHLNPTIDDAIKGEHENLMDERSKYFNEIRQRLKLDRRLRELVKARLHDIGCSTCWNSISS